MSSLVQAKWTNSSAGPSSASSVEPFLDQVFDRLDVVVGGALDLLDARGVGDARNRSASARSRDSALAGERRQFDDARLRGQRQQPFDLDLHPAP